VTTIPAIISSRNRTSPLTFAAPPRNRTLSHPTPSAIEMTGSAAVMIAWTGASSVPCWKASCASTKPVGPATART
jgi:hypothetical protein